MSIDIEVTTREQPSFTIIRDACVEAGYSEEHPEERYPDSWAWRKSERGRLVTSVASYDPDDPDNEYRASDGTVAVGARWELTLHFSSVPYKNTLADAMRIAQAIARVYDGVILLDGESLPLDYEVVDERDGWRGVWDFWCEIRRARQEYVQQLNRQ